MTFTRETRKLAPRQHRTREVPIRTSLQNVPMRERGMENGGAPPCGPLEGHRFTETARQVFEDHQILMVPMSDPSLSIMQTMMLEEIAYQLGVKQKRKNQ